ncbi:MAG: hypothetical protein ACYC26_13100 [Phycisphaerales bacterium]
MTKLLEKAFKEASRLPSKDQDVLAHWLLEELQSEQRWSQLLEQSSDFLDHLADQARKEHSRGRSEPIELATL